MTDLPSVHNRHAPARCHGDALLRAALKMECSA